MADFTGTTGDDAVGGSKRGDTFDYSQGGHDHVNCKAGNDTVMMGGALDALDSIDGSDGYDAVQFAAASFTITLGATTLLNVEELRFGSGSYNLTTHNGTVAAGATLAVLGAGATVIYFNGAAETDGHFTMESGTGNDTLIGGALSDVIFGGSSSFVGATDVLTGNGGDDLFKMFDDLGKSDKISGGDGFDTVWLDGNYAAQVAFTTTTMTGIEEIDLDRNGGHFGYNLKFNDTTVAAGQTLTVYANSAGNATLDGSLELNGRFVFYGGANFDDLFGGAGNDVLQGGGEADLLKGNGGADLFVYTAPSDSTKADYDAIVGIDFTADKFKVPAAVAGIDAVISHGTLSNASFDANLVTFVSSAKLGIHHAVLFKPDAGDHMGDAFLVVDVNGVAGYQSGADLVIYLQSPVNTAGIGVEDFTT